jgi:hypothetical protein
MTERVSQTTDFGVVALKVAYKVVALQRLPGNKMKVTDGRNEFTIKNSQATNDLDVARAAEEKDYVQHGGRL